MISIIIPLYNKAHTIIKTLNTVFAQTFQDFEVIIVDDGSTDDGGKLIKTTYNDSRIRVIRQNNGGVSSARNVGIKVSKGEWIAFLDADDEWMPEYLSTLIEAAKGYPGIDMLISGRYSQNIVTTQRHKIVPSQYADKVVEVNFFYNPHVFVHISATIIRAKLLKDQFDTFGSFIEGQKFNEDFTFLYRVALHCRCLYIGKPLAIYNGGVEGQTTSNIKRTQKLKDNILMRNLVINEWCATGQKNKICGIFMKYEVRHVFLGLLRKHDYVGLRSLIEGMNNNCRRLLLGTLDRKLLNNPFLNRLAIIYIYGTKLIWRMHGFPVVR